MKKGFTLVELLIVMVIVSLLVTIAVPKYKTAMERARGQEGLTNAAAISEALNAYYVLNGNSYGSGSAAKDYALGNSSRPGVAGVVASNYFTPSVTNDSSSKQTVTLSRSTGSYSIVFVNQDGEVSERYCTTSARYCKAIGASVNRSGDSWSF